MARMLPAAPGAHTVSDAERFLFGRIRDRCPADWTVLHSLGLTETARKPWAEADYVVVTPAGVLVLEVKGGHVSRKGRVWYTYDDPLKQSPFDQAAGAAAALAKDIHAHVPGAGRVVVGHAVVFPDVRFEADGPDLDLDLVLDAGSVDTCLPERLSDVVKLWQHRIASLRAGTDATVSTEVTQAIVDRLAGDFSLRPSLRARLAAVDDELARLTDEQRHVLEALEANPRILVDGAAGTGKTWLALEEAFAAADRGSTVLLTCSSRALAATLRRAARDRPLIHVEHFHGITGRLIHQAALQLPDAAPDALFRRFHPELALEALRADPNPQRFDHLVLDEAQDLLAPPALELLDQLLDGGISAGTWRIFRDPRQDLFDGTALGAIDRFPDAQPARFRLSVNCRNTAEIAARTAIVARRALDETLPVSGPPVDYFYFDDDEDQRSQVGAVLERWLDAGVLPREIVILSLRRLEHTSLADGLPPEVPVRLRTESLPEAEGDLGPGEVRFSTIAGFKGLESRAVVVTDVGDLTRDELSVDRYVGLSRARGLLAVGVAQSQREELRGLVREYGRKLAAVTPDGA
mgnify:CR=1 FL=1